MTERLTIKVCGMRDSANIRQVEATGADWMGFIFYPASKRYVTARPDHLPAGCRRIGVFVNAQAEDIVATASAYGLYGVQLHGDESADECRRLRSLLPDGIVIIKAISIGCAADMGKTSQYADVVDYFLFDTACKGYGGSGEAFSWDILDGYDGTVPFILSGGIGPENVEDILRLRHPRLAGIDVNSRFETAPAVKDAAAIAAFIRRLRQL